MNKRARTALLAITALLLAACNSDATNTDSESGVGGANSGNANNDSEQGIGGAAQSSKASTAKGGSVQKTSANGVGGNDSNSNTNAEQNSDGGTTSVEESTEGGTSSSTIDSAKGGSTPNSTKTSSGGASSTTAKAPGGGATSVNTTANPGGGASSSSTSAGRAMPAGGVSATGGRSSTRVRPGAGGSSTTGAVATGGAQASGGSVATGGAQASGGSVATGGATSASNLEKFSFFVTSYAAMKRLSGNTLGFGGDLRYGESTGLAGADKICTEIAETSMKGAGAKGWRAFLSTSSVNAIDRITYDGPLYDRRGRVVATNKAALTSGERPGGADSSIANDLPNEDGIANHAPDGTQVDNHDVLTGSTSKGAKTGDTCSDWTNATSTGSIQIGHSWPAHGNSWLQAHTVNGCKPGCTFCSNANAESGQSGTVGNMGGYGAIYCLALQP